MDNLEKYMDIRKEKGNEMLTRKHQTIDAGVCGQLMVKDTNLGKTSPNGYSSTKCYSSSKLGRLILKYI